MAKTEQFSCDVCGRPKRDVNKWFRVRRGEAFHIYYWDFDREGALDDSIETLHVCGQECLLKLLQPFLDDNR